MNSTNNNLTAAVIETFTQEAYNSYIQSWIGASAFALLLYAALSKLPQEVELIWFKPFSIPTLLYIFTRYAALLLEGFNLLLGFQSLGRACNMLANVSNSFVILSFVGVQGLLVARAYSLCRGNKILTTVLAFCFFSGLIVNLYGIIAFPGCIISYPAGAVLFSFVGYIIAVVEEILIVGICIWKVWGAWKLKREAGIQSNGSLVSVVLAQSILRCCFVVVVTGTSAVIVPVLGSNLESSITNGFTRFQNVLSSILVADFTLDLRRLNSAKIETSNVSLSTLRFSNALQHVHESFLAEMGTPEERNAEDEDESGNRNDAILGSTNDMEIQPAA